MREHRRFIRSEDDLLIDAVQEVAAALGPIVAELAEARARFIVAEEIERRGLVPRSQFDDEVSPHELYVAILRRLADHAKKPRATAAGAHDVARRVGVSMGVSGSESYPALRRTRAQVDANPSPHRRREGRAGAAAGQRVAEGGSDRW